MAKINQLSSKIYNRIAAGEVVERPASVIKELVENSIDADAKNISIEIYSGGISSISVCDDGGGIEKNDVKKAILPHATSKISSLSDLDNITSLGFRGEALASIASVSKLTIVSKTNEDDYGTKLYAEGGEIVSVDDSPRERGTTVTVNNIFYNTPAREKFLKSTRAEEGEITITIARFILGNPQIAFKYCADGKQIFQSFGDGEEAAFAQIYGATTLNDCFRVDTDKNGIKIRGYIGKHYFTKGNRNYQTVFINGRYVSNQTIASAISNAYSSYLMKRQYPFYVLAIDVPTGEIDCNVHPNKIDVRFANNQIIYGSIYSVVSKVLDGTSEALDIVVNNDVLSNNKSQTIQQNAIENNTEYVTHNTYKNVAQNTLSFDELILNDVSTKKAENKDDVFFENKKYIFETEKITKAVQQSIEVERCLTYIGQALNTYLIFEDGKNIFFIDQHAAHERILYDKLNASMQNNSVDVQPLLVPYVLTVNANEYDFLTQKLEVLHSLGIEIEEFGINTFKVSALPVCLIDIDFKLFFDDVFGDLFALKAITLSDVLKDKIAQKACKSAIKSGDKLSNNDVSVILSLLKGNIGLKCPHGRPIAIKITRTEIDKWFKRII